MTQGARDARTGNPPMPASVSIVLATNRDSPYLEKALLSVREQTIVDWELLIVDNGIPDPRSVERLIEGDDRMRMITIESSATAGVARNVGAAQTTGELITFLDDYDVWAAERLERHLRAQRDVPRFTSHILGVLAHGQRGASLRHGLEVSADQRNRDPEVAGRTRRWAPRWSSEEPPSRPSEGSVPRSRSSSTPSSRCGSHCEVTSYTSTNFLWGTGGTRAT